MTEYSLYSVQVPALALALLWVTSSLIPPSLQGEAPPATPNAATATITKATRSFTSMVTKATHPLTSMVTKATRPLTPMATQCRCRLASKIVPIDGVDPHHVFRTANGDTASMYDAKLCEPVCPAGYLEDTDKASLLTCCRPHNFLFTAFLDTRSGIVHNRLVPRRCDYSQCLSVLPTTSQPAQPPAAATTTAVTTTVTYPPACSCELRERVLPVDGTAGQEVFRSSDGRRLTHYTARECVTLCRHRNGLAAQGDPNRECCRATDFLQLEFLDPANSVSIRLVPRSCNAQTCMFSTGTRAGPAGGPFTPRPRQEPTALSTTRSVLTTFAATTAGLTHTPSASTAAAATVHAKTSPSTSSTRDRGATSRTATTFTKPSTTTGRSARTVGAVTEPSTSAPGRTAAAATATSPTATASVAASTLSTAVPSCRCQARRREVPINTLEPSLTFLTMVGSRTSSYERLTCRSMCRAASGRQRFSRSRCGPVRCCRPAGTKTLVFLDLRLGIQTRRTAERCQWQPPT